MQIKLQKQITILVCCLLFLPETILFSQNQGQPQPQAKELKTDLNKFADDTAYENANQFYKLKNYNLALGFFTEYIEIYLNGIHRKEVHKKIALIYFEQFNYIKSIKAFNSLYEEFSNSEEGIEAYFMTGICYQKMGFLDNAKRVFKSIIEEHPESSFNPQAKIKLDLLEILEKA